MELQDAHTQMGCEGRSGRVQTEAREMQEAHTQVENSEEDAATQTEEDHNLVTGMQAPEKGDVDMEFPKGDHFPLADIVWGEDEVWPCPCRVDVGVQVGMVGEETPLGQETLTDWVYQRVESRLRAGQPIGGQQFRKEIEERHGRGT